MARVVKEYDERYAEFLDVAQRLFYTKGYAQTPVQEIIDAIGVAKGTFYHYFDSKGDLLDALIERMLTQQLQSLTPLMQDTTTDAATKFSRFFDHFGSWKVANKAFFIDLMHVMYHDDNVLLRTKMVTMSAQRIVPVLAAIIEQGVEEGVFAVDYPAEAAEVSLQIGTALGETFVRLLLTQERGPERTETARRKVHAYERSLERVLGAAEGSVHVIEPTQIREWLE
ncbi:MAG: TetR/AcrR family transcriptional regulator [Caldilineaceae bacterium]